MRDCSLDQSVADDGGVASGDGGGWRRKCGRREEEEERGDCEKRTRSPLRRRKFGCVRREALKKKNKADTKERARRWCPLRWCWASPSSPWPPWEKVRNCRRISDAYSSELCILLFSSPQ